MWQNFGEFFYIFFLVLPYLKMYLTLYVCMLKDTLVHGKRQPTGQRGEVPKLTYFPNPASKLGAHGTPPTAYYCQSAGSAANFALGLSGLPRGHKDQLGISRPCKA